MNNIHNKKPGSPQLSSRPVTSDVHSRLYLHHRKPTTRDEPKLNLKVQPLKEPVKKSI